MLAYEHVKQKTGCQKFVVYEFVLRPGQIIKKTYNLRNYIGRVYTIEK